jgi:hypothetical protein
VKKAYKKEMMMKGFKVSEREHYKMIERILRNVDRETVVRCIEHSTQQLKEYMI